MEPPVNNLSQHLLRMSGGYGLVTSRILVRALMWLLRGGAGARKPTSEKSCPKPCQPLSFLSVNPPNLTTNDR